ncbi:MAG: hypothetical protein CBB87_01725 [Micavibrio sp. TMED27]|nr:ribonuclease [Micavibrio sp.]OUT92484.1 MAG: hypothetical protein CBB87_01725 [Micavibrio sp. TMED27]|tara:strand:- start:11973 stop:14627 length:2655 start_codon:yes stop_codon:yes gene_type:complete
MTKKMIIDATHEEETRVAVVEDGRLAEFEYESSFRKPLKGNIFLAKVTRVEPSLQAAFVNYGGNRHGFLPFSEIHPDYFRIPISDREALIAEQEEALRLMEEQDEEEEANAEQADVTEDSDEGEDDVVEELGGEATELDQEGDANADEEASDEIASEEAEDENDKNGNVIANEDENDVDGNQAEGEEASDDENDGNRRRGRGRGRGRGGRGGRGRGRNAQHRSKRVETFGGDEMDEEQRFRFNLRRKYKIQEVIKRGQIMLVQVAKEERGNKGAAVSSYLSLPGRYCVLMPNSPRAGGVSRKISNYKDRAKMRDLLKDLEVPKGMSVILRTAGVTRTKTEVKRDLDYLMRLWNNIRELTLESSAPAMVYEEADLVKRAVRDLYTRDIDTIEVAGTNGYKTAKDFMKMMIPSHAKRVVEYKKDSPTLFHKHRVEEQIADIGETTVTLKSGGYLIINPTEALVSIDVNSGRATKERHIEETALKTNLEAAEEVARQLRLRDLGGLVVIDFIDMEDRRNNSKVERKMRDALSGDKARIQMGRISSFGLMEMSRQRMSASLGETQFETCPHCEGSGRIRTADAASILVLRDIEAEGQKGRAAEVMVHVSANVAIYILNNKRQNLADLEARYDIQIVIRVDDSLGASGCRVEVSKPKQKDGKSPKEESEDTQNTSEEDNQEDGKGRRRRGRRGGRRRGKNREDQDAKNQEDGAESDENQNEAPKVEAVESQEENNDDKPKKRGRRAAAKKNDSDNVSVEAPAEQAEAAKEEEKPKRGRKKAVKKEDAGDAVDAPKEAEAAKEEEKPKRGRKKAVKKEDAGDAVDAPKEAEAAKEEEKPKRGRKKAVKKKAEVSNDDKPAAEKPEAPKEYETVNEAPKDKKKGWWNRLVD